MSDFVYLNFQTSLISKTFKQGCHMVRKIQEIRKSQEKLRKMTKVRKSQEKLKKTDFVSSNLLNSLYLKALNSKQLIKNSLKLD